MSQSRARLVEVGATNRTHLKDYQKAITADTAAIMRVHPSNYRVVGFTSEVPLPEHWGGYLLRPRRIEFWQGRRSRLHDRVAFLRAEEGWTILRLSP